MKIVFESGFCRGDGVQWSLGMALAQGDHCLIERKFGQRCGKEKWPSTSRGAGSQEEAALGARGPDL